MKVFFIILMITTINVFLLIDVNCENQKPLEIANNAIEKIKAGDLSVLSISLYEPDSELVLQFAKSISEIQKQESRRQLAFFTINLEKKRIGVKWLSPRSNNKDLVDLLITVVENEHSNSICSMISKNLYEWFDPQILAQQQDRIKKLAIKTNADEVFLLYASLPTVKTEDVQSILKEMKKPSENDVTKALARHGDKDAEKHLIEAAEESTKTGEKVRSSFEALSYAASPGICEYLAKGLHSDHSVELPGGQIRSKSLICADALIHIYRDNADFPFLTVDKIKSDENLALLEKWCTDNLGITYPHTPRPSLISIPGVRYKPK